MSVGYRSLCTLDRLNPVHSCGLSYEPMLVHPVFMVSELEGYVCDAFGDPVRDREGRPVSAFEWFIEFLQRYWPGSAVSPP